MSKEKPFWQTKSLSEMSKDEWESLCDGCGKCCLHKLEDDQTGEVHYTNVACRLLDLKTIRCSKYATRHRFVADCISLTPENINSMTWLPKSCAYVLVAKGQALPHWHHLISHDKNSVHMAHASVKGLAISEREADDLQDHIIKL